MFHSTLLSLFLILIGVSSVPILVDLEKLEADLRRDEGLRLEMYRCTGGARTIGYGHNLDSHPLDDGEMLSLGEAKRMTKEFAEYLLRKDVDRVLNEINHFAPWVWTLSERRQRAIANMVFNLGITRFLEFDKTIGLLKAGQFRLASEHLRHTKWAGQVGARANRIREDLLLG